MVPSSGHLAMSGDPAGLHIWEEALLASPGEAQAAPQSRSSVRGGPSVPSPEVGSAEVENLAPDPRGLLRGQHGVCEPLSERGESLCRGGCGQLW